MNKIDILDKQKFIFGRLISLSNKLQTIGDNALGSDDITIRQWLLTVAVAQFGHMPPTLSEVSQVMGTSRQNVKQLAVKLQKKGFLHIKEDEQDGRSIRLEITEKSRLFWGKRHQEIRNFLAEVFAELSREEINSLYDCLNKLYEGILKAEKSLNV
jgi:DNA-binding MarR family transcriptional regulator